MKTNNYLVTYNDLTTMGLFPIGTPPTGNRIATKSFITSNYYVESSYLSGYASNQCVMYQDIVSSTIYYFNVYTVNPADCSTTYSFAAYTVNDPHTNGFYTFDGPLYYFENTTYNSPTVNATYGLIPSSCTPTTPYYPALADLSGYGSSSDSCAFSNTNISLYATTDNPATATFYSNTALTVLGTDTYPELADGNYHYLTLGGTAYSVTFASDSTCGNVSYC